MSIKRVGKYLQQEQNYSRIVLGWNEPIILTFKFLYFIF